MSETYRDTPSATPTSLAEDIGFNEEFFVGKNVHLYLPGDDALLTELHSGGIYADNDFLRREVPFLVSSSVQSIDSGGIGKKLLADISFDLTHASVTEKYIGNKDLSVWLSELMLKCLKSKNGMRALRSPNVYQDSLAIYLSYGELSEIVLSSRVGGAGFGVRMGHIVIASDVDTDVDEETLIYTFRELVNIWALAHNEILNLKPIGKERQWRKDHPAGLTLAVGGEQATTLSHTETALFQIVARLHDLYIDPNDSWRIPDISQLDSLAINEYETPLLDRHADHQNVANKLTQLMGDLVLSRMRLAESTNIQSALTTDDITAILRVLSKADQL